MSDLLRRLRENRGLSQREMAEALRTTEHYYGKIERGEKGVSKIMALKLERFYNVPASRFLSASANVSSDRVTTITGDLEPEHATLDRSRKITLGRGPLPVLGGAVGTEDYPYQVDKLKVVGHRSDRPASLDGVVDAFAIYMIGETMRPRYNPGELLFIHPHLPALPGDYVLVRLVDGRGTVKQYVGRERGKVRLKQLSPEKEYLVDADEIAAMQQVVQAGKP